MAKNSRAKSNNGATKKSAGKKERKTASVQQKIKEPRISLWSQISPFIMIVAAILLSICLFTGSGNDPGVVIKFLYNVFTGLFGGAAFIIPFFLLYGAVCGFLDKNDKGYVIRTVFAGICSYLICVLLELISPINSFAVKELFVRGTALKGGGVLGGLLGEAFLVCFKSIASYVLVGASVILTFLLALGLTPKYVFYWAHAKSDEAKYKRMQKREADAKAEAEYSNEEYYDESDEDYEDGDEPYDFEQDNRESKRLSSILALGKRKKQFDTDIPVEGKTGALPGETDEEMQERINAQTFDEVMQRSKATKSKEVLDAEKAALQGGDGSDFSVNANPVHRIDSGIDILDEYADKYESENGTLPLKVDKVSDASEKITGTQITIKEPRPEYKFPPIELLKKDPGKKSGNVRDELHDNAEKLVSVLASFNVKTRIVGVSRGPTITRYELLPEAGIRVRSIANLVDDIALNLATSGVRIEAPIPGKAAVGIEVPNKQAETVYLRSLVSDDRFAKSESKLATCLGMDVAGEPIIMDIAKMPHLLIAGATGMGKSVCINCTLVSLLCKASPEDVKMILIDPKKVEFSIYSGLPHLLVPVVSDPKKAAGALAWAVNEMERRFGLIESVGVRDIAGYNKITANDPEREHMPQIIIVIDELADLMATAANEVETSIARLAAKARAAGMHLVIGTQRPSVDVITGVIKANIPSRIAFTVASQVDSRTIIDRAGAENLIGRGDMLYSPVGSSKPQRVQGAFVSDSEVDSIVQFIKTNNKTDGDNYDSNVMKEIDNQAAMCGNKKGSSSPLESVGGSSSDGDPLIDKAMEIAFESGKISTSLLQRRLSVGYGRAAKIIDFMEQKGYVSSPEGQKPRELLISRDEYFEMKVSDTENSEE